MWLYSSLNTFYFINFIKQNREENYIELLLVELLQIFNPASLPLLKLFLKVGVPIIFLQNLYPKEGLYNSTYIVIIRLGRHCIKTQIFSSSFYRQLWLIPYIKLTSMDGELPFIISKRQFPTQLCFAIIVNKSQGQSFNFISINLCILVFTYRQLYVALLRVIDIRRLSLLLPQEGGATTTNIIYLEVLLLDSIVVVIAVAAAGQQQGSSMVVRCSGNQLGFSISSLTTSILATLRHCSRNKKPAAGARNLLNFLSLLYYSDF